MQTTFWFYVAFALIIVLPLILLNLKKFRILDKSGDFYKVNKIRVSIVSVLSILVILFAIGLYNFTIAYQPMIIAERYYTEVGKLQTGKITMEQFEKDTESYVEYASDKAEDIQSLLNSLAGNKSTQIKFQIGDEITPRYYTDVAEDIFQEVPDNDGKENPVYIGIHSDVDGRFQNYLILVRKLESNSVVENIYPINEEAMTYLENNKFMRGDLVSKWFDVK